MAESQIKVKFVMALTSGKRNFVEDTPLAADTLRCRHVALLLNQPDKSGDYNTLIT